MAQKKKNTELTLAAVKKQAKIINEQETYDLEDGSTIKFYPIFPELMIEALFEELQRHYVEMKEKEIELTDKRLLNLINLLAIKHFTHFKKTMPDKLLGEGTKPGLLDYLEYFADTGLMKTIIDEVFNSDQIKKVHEKMTEIMGASKLIQELETVTQAKYEQMKYKHNLENESVTNK
ncbi:hypothetical protein P4597_26970 [Peribacillus simplex]|uniref:hypothetical protein n=1 Tax=Peribacillus simplex TaxID=1478 RepID=UPI002E1F6BD8|nr:hypothetical protein [Peribacillus simplex]